MEQRCFKLAKVLSENELTTIAESLTLLLEKPPKNAENEIRVLLDVFTDAKRAAHWLDKGEGVN